MNSKGMEKAVVGTMIFSVNTRNITGKMNAAALSLQYRKIATFVGPYEREAEANMYLKSININKHSFNDV